MLVGSGLDPNCLQRFSESKKKSPQLYTNNNVNKIYSADVIVFLKCHINILVKMVI